jgi:transposase-like protein
MFRSRLSPEQKVELVMLGIASPGKVSELCRQYGVHPSLFYRWKKQFLEGGKRYLSYNVSTEDKAVEKELKKLREVVGSLYVENAFLKSLAGGKMG